MNKYKGLTTKDAEFELKKFGKNVLKEEKPPTAIQMFFKQLINWTNFILFVAIVISIALKDYGEASIIGIIVIANGIIGVIQEGKAQKALSSLKQMSVLKATVLRDGEKQEISSENLVVGDIVFLEAGQQVPADLILLETANLKIDEKSLTGESVPVEKDSSIVSDANTSIGDRLDHAYMSTVVTYGRAVGKVINIGMNTEIGKIADMLESEKEKPSPLQKAMAILSKTLGFICVGICVGMFLIGMIQGRNVVDMLITSVSLAVAAIPEGIPTIVTIVLALGMQRMAKENAIVKSLPSVETLGAVTYVCSDKTGTLTQNKMTVIKVYVNMREVLVDKIDAKEDDLFVNGFALCTDAHITNEGKEIGDPTETALINFAKKYRIEKYKLENDMPRINEKPFDSERKLMTTVHKYYQLKNKTISFTKGSTDELLKRCTKIMIDSDVVNLTNNHKTQIMKEMKSMSDEALRVLSLAIKFDNDEAEENDLIYIGMVGMIDPERQEVVESIKTFKKAGIKTVMITGDHKDTALAIAKKLGIAENPNECIMGNEIEKLTDEELQEKVKTLSIFARVSPEHKVRIVKALQNNGNVVSMTGDGVNDAPSLKVANVGIAMGITGTDVAKGAADIILQDDLFTTIEKAIKEGRNIYENLKKSIIFALSSNISEIITMVFAILLGLPSPLRAVHILWVNLLTDSLPCFALGVDPNSSSDVMNKKPRKENESIFDNGGLKLVVIYGIVIALITLGGFIYLPIRTLIETNQGITLENIIDCYNVGDILLKSQTYAFSALALAELFHAIGMRDVEHSIFKFKWFDNKIMLLAFAAGLIGQLAVTELGFLTNMFETIGLNGIEWLTIILISMIPLVIHELLIIINKKKN